MYVSVTFHISGRFKSFSYCKSRCGCFGSCKNTSYFSEAELRVVKLLASGSSEKEIADRLCISRHTVDNHLRNIRERFGLHKNTEIILLYIAHLNHKPFSLSNIKQYGLEVILVLINVCTYTDLKSL